MTIQQEQNAKELILAYLNQLPPAYRDSAYLMAYYVAVPMVFTTEMLYQLWLNFNRFVKNGKTEQIHIVSIADLIQSNLCEKIGYELYEMEEDVVEYFRKLSPADIQERRKIQISEHSRREVAEFVLAYADNFLNNPKYRNLYDVYNSKLLWEVSPTKAIKQLKHLLDNAQDKTGKKQVRMWIEHILKEEVVAKNETAEYNKVPILSATRQPNNSYDITDILKKDEEMWERVQVIIKKDEIIYGKPENILALENYLGFELTEIKSKENIINFNKGKTYLLNKNRQIIGLNLCNSYLQNAYFLINYTHLNILNLSSNNILDISFLKDLHNLQILYLSDNQISDISFLKGLHNLQNLYLRDNKISDISCLKDLYKLKKLDISKNKISNISFLKGLQNLQDLDLSEHQILDISFLKDLQNLQNLFLRANKILDISCLKDLQNLQNLDLSDNQISDISFLKDLHNLQNLYISKTKVSDISFLKGLTNLTRLYLSNNQITHFPEDLLEKLPNLKELYLYGNPIDNLPKDFFDFAWNCLEKVKEYFMLKTAKPIQIFELEEKLGFVLEEDKEFSGTLYWRTYLLNNEERIIGINLADSRFSDFSFLGNFIDLTFLVLNGNIMTNHYFLERLPNLIHLELAHNHITDITFLKNLNNLETLHLEGNQITRFPEELLKKLPNLKELYLYDNPIQNIPQDIFNQTPYSSDYSDDYYKGNCLPKVKAYFAQNIEYAKILIQEAQEKGLKTLDLGNLGLTSLDDLPELFELKELEVLQLGKFYYDWVNNIFVKTKNIGKPNTIKQMPTKLNDLLHLKKLYFRNIGLEDLFLLDRFNNKRLEVLDLAGNPFKSLIPFGNLQVDSKKKLTLEELCLGGTDISYLPEKYLQNNLDTTIKYLDLSEVKSIKTKDLEQTVSRFTNLEKLNLIKNNIKNIDFLKNLPNLVSLYLSHNAINELTADFLHSFPNLQELYLQGNPIKNLPQEVFDFKGSCLEEVIKYLGIASKARLIKDLENKLNITINNVSLDYVGLEECKIGYSTDKHGKIVALTLRGLGIENIDFIKPFSDLERLYLGGNKIQSINQITSLYNLRRLGLNRNSLTDINVDLFEKMQQLDTLYLYNNPIKNLPERVFNFNGNCLDKIKDYVRKMRAEHLIYQEGFQIMIEGTEDLADVDFEFNSSSERSMGVENEYLLEVLYEGFDIQVYFYEYPVGVANSVTIDGEDKALLLNSEENLSAQFQKWLWERDKPKGYKNLENSLDYFVKYPQKTNDLSIDEHIQSLLEKDENGDLWAEISTKYPYRFYIDGVSNIEVKNIKIENNKEIQILGNGSIHIVLEPDNKTSYIEHHNIKFELNFSKKTKKWSLKLGKYIFIEPNEGQD